MIVVTNDLDTLATALHVETDDLLRLVPYRVPLAPEDRRHGSVNPVTRRSPASQRTYLCDAAGSWSLSPTNSDVGANFRAFCA